MKLWPFGRSAKTSAKKQRSFTGAQLGRLVADWNASATSADAELRGNLQLLRNRCRDLERNNDYIQSYLREVENNVIGLGIGFQSQVPMQRGQKLNEKLNQQIQDAWWKWAKAGNCDAAGQLSFTNMEHLLVRAAARDGEIFFRKIYQRFGDSRIPFGLEVIEADLLDDQFNGYAQNGNTIRMGVERDQWQRPVAYWFYSNHPGDTGFVAGPAERDTRRKRVPASEIIHPFCKQRVGQTRGVPWIASSIANIRQQQGYIEAEIIAARASASIMGFVQTPDPDQNMGEDAGQDRVTDFEPGTFKYLAPGETVTVPDLQRPGGNFSPFMKFMLRGTAAGIGVSYESIAKDYSESNYSSSRLSLLTDRDNWKKLQQWVLAEFHQPIFEAWLEVAVLSGEVKIADYEMNRERYEGVRWLTRGWSFVDPQKEIAAYREAIAGGLMSVSQVVAGQGGDRDELWREIAAERDQATELGLVFDTDAANAMATNKKDPDYLPGGESNP